jgi:predicted transcriptional regulator
MKYANDREIVLDTKKILIKENMTQRELGDKLGISEWMMSKYMRSINPLASNRSKFIEFNAMYGYNGSHEPIFDESEDDNGSEKLVELMTIDELTAKIEIVSKELENLKSIRQKKIEEEIKKIEEEVSKLFERQTEYEKLLKGEEDQA